jgi:RHS repeat-associated protein
MQQQPVSVLKKCGTGVPPVDASRCARTNKLTNILRGSRAYAPATADDRMVSYSQSSTTPSLRYSVAYTHDARGNRLGRTSNVQGQMSYGYDAFSRMTGCTNGTTSVVYAYDALGRKVKRLKRDATIYPDSTYYIYDGLDPVCTVRFNPASTECTTVTWLLRGLGVARGIGNIVAQQRYTIHFGGATSQPVTHYYHPNHRGDTAYLTDASGVTAANYVYDAFGRLLTDNGSPISDYRFSGKEWDADAQLYYFGFRWYDPDSGTWTTKDPLGVLGSDHINAFVFCQNSPIVVVDIYGLSGTLTVYSTTGHSWVTYAPSTNSYAMTNTYGTFSSVGLYTGTYSATTSTPSRSMTIDDAHEKLLMAFIESMCKKGLYAWGYLTPCSWFAAKAWSIGSGESLNHRDYGLSQPKNLQKSIDQQNGTP